MDNGALPRKNLVLENCCYFLLFPLTSLRTERSYLVLISNFQITNGWKMRSAPLGSSRSRIYEVGRSFVLSLEFSLFHSRWSLKQCACARTQSVRRTDFVITVVDSFWSTLLTMAKLAHHLVPISKSLLLRVRTSMLTYFLFRFSRSRERSSHNTLSLFYLLFLLSQSRRMRITWPELNLGLLHTRRYVLVHTKSILLLLPVSLTCPLSLL